MPASETTTEKKKVLIIDDEAPFTRLLKCNLEGTNRFIVEVENNPLAALAQAERFMPDIILLDVMMPHLDGGDLAARFQASPRFKSVPVVLFTAAVRRGEVPPGGGRIGGLRFLAKPADLQEIMRCLDECLAESCGALPVGRPSASA